MQENAMRTPEELERLAFREALTPEEDDLLVDTLLQRSTDERVPQKRTSDLKQAAFFAARAFDKGARDQQQLTKYVRLLTDVQRAAPSDSFRRKLAEMKSVLAGRGWHEAILKKLARRGHALRRDVLATDEQLDRIEVSLGVTLPQSYRHYLKQYAHRQIGTYEPLTALQLEDAVREAWASGLERYLLPFLEDNADYFCFDLRARVEEPPVVFRPHDGTSSENWAGFAAWVEECWLGEIDA
jgi:hypothetical protein